VDEIVKNLPPKIKVEWHYSRTSLSAYCVSAEYALRELVGWAQFLESSVVGCHVS